MYLIFFPGDRPHVCDQCNKGFKDRSLLKRHKRIHEKERPFSCAHCSRLFLSKCELRRHMTTHSSTMSIFKYFNLNIIKFSTYFDFDKL